MSISEVVVWIIATRMVQNLGINKASDFNSIKAIISFQGIRKEVSLELISDVFNLKEAQKISIKLPVVNKVWYTLKDIGGEDSLWELVENICEDKQRSLLNALIGTVAKFYLKYESNYDILENQYEVIKLLVLNPKNENKKLDWIEELVNWIYNNEEEYTSTFLVPFQSSMHTNKSVWCWLGGVHEMRNSVDHVQLSSAS